MKEEDITIILDALLANKDSCTIQEMNAARDRYMKKHPDSYIDNSGDTVDYYLYTYADEYFWDDKAKLIRRQEKVKCKFCGRDYRKYPDTVKYESIVESNKKTYSEEDIHKAFMAGLNRGVYVASVIKHEPIEGDYPTYEEYIIKIKNERSC
jgi:hypothetical protein